MPRALRNVLVALASLVVIAAAVVYVTTSGDKVSVSVRPGVGSSTPDGTSVFYGRISAAPGIRISRVAIDLTPLARPPARSIAITVPTVGPYRAVERLATGRYRITVRLFANGRLLTSSELVSVVSGHAYEVSVNVGSAGIFSFLPVSSY